LVSSELLAPDFVSQSTVLLEGLVTSASLAGFSAILAFPIAIVIAVLSSNTVLRLPKTTIALRRTFAILRSLPIAVVALILVIPFGLGFFTAVLAMVIGGSLFFGRLIGDQLDVMRAETLDNLWMSGASRIRLALVSLLQIRAKLKRNWFFAVDYLFRYSVILGLLGAGGLGTALSNAIRVGDIQTVSAATIVIVLVVGALEFIQQRFQTSGSTNSSKKTVVRRNS
jgi:phosphonate transport system permease protein